MRVKYYTGQTTAVFGSILMASASLYWINGFFLSHSTVSIYKALIFAAIGTLCIIIGSTLTRGDPV